jgi:fructose-bisphosphate aldolase, class I
MIPDIQTLARTLMVAPKGILAADESDSTMRTRLDPIGVAHTLENARRMRELFFGTPGVEQYLSGVILYETSLEENMSNGTSFPQALEQKGIIPGVKVDIGHRPFPNFGEEEVSYGLDALDARSEYFYSLGARFTKWRSVIRIGEGTPSDAIVSANAHILAHYAALVQARHMVPIVEPEVLFDGIHTIERSRDVLQHTLQVLFETLRAYKVSLPGLILKTSMALPGKESETPLRAPDIARETVAALVASVPKETAGVVFLSGGQTPTQATENLSCIAAHETLPWPVTFSYSRALEEEALRVWGGMDEHRSEARDRFTQRLKLVVAARNGSYHKDMEH